MRSLMLIVVPDGDDALRADVQAAAPDAAVSTFSEIGETGRLADVEVVFGGMPWPLADTPSLRWVQLLGAGIDGSLSDEMRTSGVVVTNARIHAAPIAEHLFGMVLMLTRRLDVALRHQQAGRWEREELSATADVLSGRCLGVLGLGSIGAHMARIGAAMEMSVVGLTRHGRPHPAAERMFTPDTRIEFFRASDVVMNVLPLTPETRGFVGADELAAMPARGIYANAGRGATTDTDALVDALVSGRLAGACLDVTDPEPLPEGHPLWTAPNALITPHYAGGHLAYMQNAAATFLRNLRCYVAGEPLENVVDKAAGY
jgi:D-2-hydroxyacid dehydrogenase (NADP+)